MSSVVHLNAYRSKGTLTALRELLVLAARGQIEGFRFEVTLKGGGRKAGTTGKLVQEESDEDHLHHRCPSTRCRSK